jgi:hypothetical protein
MTADEGVAPGWYQDPGGSPALRWWDGTQWTEYLSQPAAPAQDESDPVMRWLVPVGRSGWAIAAGYAGLFAVLIVTAPLALLLGIVAVLDIRRKGRRGMGRAVFGIVMGAIGSVVLGIVVISSMTT